MKGTDRTENFDRNTPDAGGVDNINDMVTKGLDTVQRKVKDTLSTAGDSLSRASRNSVDFVKEKPITFAASCIGLAACGYLAYRLLDTAFSSRRTRRST